MKLKLKLFVFFILMQTLVVDAQSAEKKDSAYLPKGWEFTSNVTLALSRFTGNVTRNLNDDPYLMMFRNVNLKKNTALRIGANGFRRKTDEKSIVSSRTGEENAVSLVIGKEWRKELGLGIYAYYGCDTRGLWRQNMATAIQTDIRGNQIETITNAKEYGASFGGIMGLGWKFHERLTVYTESVVYGQYLKTDRRFIVNGVATPLEFKETYSVIPMVPIALFLSVRF